MILLLRRHGPDHLSLLVGQRTTHNHLWLPCHEGSEPTVVAAPFLTTQRITLMAPTMSSLRMPAWPILLTAPSFVFPPVDLCRGTRPSHAAKLRPLSKVSRPGAKAATAPAVTGPIPGVLP